MRLEFQILAAVALDMVFGDPRWLPHPVRGIGLLAKRLEPLARRWVAPPKLAGIVTALSVYAVAGVAVWGSMGLADRFHPWAADAVSIVVIYTTIAARDLGSHSMAVFRPLAAGDLAEARRRVGWLVGRDTRSMNQSEVVRATLESVGENTVDGVTAPLLYAALAGPVGAMVYRAINTLDSMFGYRDEPYREFGWASARIDDLANYLPARLTAPLVCLASALQGGTGLSLRRPWHALRIMARDGRKHASPNSGLAEAAMAGALGVQLGGVSYYGGEALERPQIGDPLRPPAVGQIPQATALMWTTTALFLALCLAVRIGVVHFCHLGRAVG
jgi:adenosylcobinamide-phosphate synthase